VCDRVAAPAAKVAELLQQAEDDLLAFLDLPVEHRSKLRSTNPLEGSIARSPTAASPAAC
jgi:putative transposase